MERRALRERVLLRPPSTQSLVLHLARRAAHDVRACARAGVSEGWATRRRRGGGMAAACAHLQRGARRSRVARRSGVRQAPRPPWRLRRPEEFGGACASCLLFFCCRRFGESRAPCQHPTGEVQLLTSYNCRGYGRTSGYWAEEEDVTRGMVHARVQSRALTFRAHPRAMSSDSSEVSADETWSDIGEAEEQASYKPAVVAGSYAHLPQPTRCLFSDLQLASPAEALLRAAQSFAFDFDSLRKARQHRLALDCLCSRHCARDGAGAAPGFLRLHQGSQLQPRAGAAERLRDARRAAAALRFARLSALLQVASARAASRSTSSAGDRWTAPPEVRLASQTARPPQRSRHPPPERTRPPRSLSPRCSSVFARERRVRGRAA